MTETKEKKPGVGDFLRSSYAGKFIRKYKWNYLAGMAILIVIDIAQTRLPLIVGGIIDKVDHRTATPLDFRTAILTMIFIAVLVLQQNRNGIRLLAVLPQGDSLLDIGRHGREKTGQGQEKNEDESVFHWLFHG